MRLPIAERAADLVEGPRRVFVGAFGFEKRSLAWPLLQSGRQVIETAVVAKYAPSKGKNRIAALTDGLELLGCESIHEVPYDVTSPHTLEGKLQAAFSTTAHDVDEVVVDTSAMTKLLILVSLMKLAFFDGTVRIIYSELLNYPPTKAQFEQAHRSKEAILAFPSVGVESIVRMKCLSSVRMQGHPVVLVAFTSFNEQLVRHMLGTMAPHRLVLIGGRPRREGYEWRQRAMEDIHRTLISEYRLDNPTASLGELCRSVDLIDYRDTVAAIDEIHRMYGAKERIICAATGSKMQTVGLLLSKVKHPDLHIEYPTPDYYNVSTSDQLTKDLQPSDMDPRVIHEICIPRFRTFMQALAKTGRLMDFKL